MDRPHDFSHVPAVIRAADIGLILGVSLSTAYACLREVRKALHKKKGQVVSFSEFCDYKGVKFHDAERALRPRVRRIE